MNPEMNKLCSAMERWNIELGQEKLEKFNKYMKLLLEWNEKINLTAITEPEEIVIQHFMDSVSPLNIDLLKNDHYVIDVGSGAGFPGLPLKIMMPELKLVLLDSLKKRTEFLNRVVDVLELENVEIIHGRAEELGKKAEYREKFDIVVSRAVASLRVLAEYCVPFVKKDSYFISYKGPAADRELEEARNALEELGAGNAYIREISVPYSERCHKLIIIQKIAKTPNKYPRSSGKVKKSPL